MFCTKEKINSLKRIKEEYKWLCDNPIFNIGASVSMPNPDNILEWRCTISGPRDTSYGRGFFYLTIQFPDNYPTGKPEVFFTTPIYHLNVNPIKRDYEGAEPLGHVDISTLCQWKPEYNIRKVLCDIFILLYEPNPECAYQLKTAYEFRYNRNLYEEKVKYFTKKYAFLGKAYKEYNESWDFSYPDK